MVRVGVGQAGADAAVHDNLAWTKLTVKVWTNFDLSSQVRAVESVLTDSQIFRRSGGKSDSSSIRFEINYFGERQWQCAAVKRSRHAIVRRTANGAPMDFSVSYAQLSAEVAVVRIVGEVDVYRAPRVREVLGGRVDHGQHLVIVDMRETDALDATGLGVLVACQKRVRAQRGALVVVTRQEGVLRQFRSTGMARVLPVRPTVAQAVAELARVRPAILLHPLELDGESVQVL